MSHKPFTIKALQALNHHSRVMRTASNPNTDPRVVAILGASFLESYLVDLIAASLPGLNSELRGRIFDTRGALSEFAAKIDMARALDLINSVYRNDCIIVARIRNRFAHNLDIQDFDHPEIAKLLMKLDYVTRIMSDPDASYALSGTAREKFVTTILFLGGGLYNALNAMRMVEIDGPDSSQSK